MVRRDPAFADKLGAIVGLYMGKTPVQKSEIDPNLDLTIES